MDKHCANSAQSSARECAWDTCRTTADHTPAAVASRAITLMLAVVTAPRHTSTLPARSCVRVLRDSDASIRPGPTYVRAFRMQTVSEYQMSHLNTEHNDYAHLKERPRGRVHATPP